MKKFLAAVVCLWLLVSTLCAAAYAETAETVKVYVTIADASGKLAVAQVPVSVNDADKDGVISINDALFAAHEAKYSGGAASGYAFSMGSYGLQMDKLWGAENGTGYGYGVNNTSAMGLADPVKNGDYVYAFVYTDTNAFSDAYCYFDSHVISAVEGEKVELVLSAAGWDANWSPITVPVADAVITVDGIETEVRTNAQGKAVLTLTKGTHLISASSDEQVLVPPVCMAEVTAKSVGNVPETDDQTPATGGEDAMFVVWMSLFGASAIGLIALVYATKKKVYEK